MKSLFSAGGRGVERIGMINDVWFPTWSAVEPRNRVKHSQNAD
jgi:hypothetical protein